MDVQLDQADAQETINGTAIAAEIGTFLASQSVGEEVPADEANNPPSEHEKYLYLSRRGLSILTWPALLFLPALLSLFNYSRTVPFGWTFAPLVVLMMANWTIGLWSNSRSSRVTLLSHRGLVHSYQPHTFPSVDVFLPTCGEPLGVLMRTYRSVALLSWPGQLHVYVLDDANRPEVRVAAESHGFAYFSRPNPGEMKKAGNLRFAFDRTDGDFILVLDADFCPRPEMVAEMLPYFDDGIGIVQTPQFFDVTARQNWVQASAGATQELFYRWVQPSRDRRNAAICVGTNAIYSRTALNAAGGFCQIEHSEDVHTGFGLLKAGYTVRYVPVILAKGLCPSELTAFVRQQYRWATGSLSLSTSAKYWRARSVPWRTRAPFLAGFLYYVVTALAVVFGSLPGPLLMWLAPELLHASNYLPFVGCYVSCFIFWPLATQGRLSPRVLRIQMIYSFAHFVALIDKLSGRTEGWLATGVASRTPMSNRILRLAAVVSSAGLLLSMSGVLNATLQVGIMRVWPAYPMFAFGAWIALPVVISAARAVRN